MGEVLLSSLLGLKGEKGNASAHVLAAKRTEWVDLGEVKRILFPREAVRNLGDFLLRMVLNCGVYIGMEGTVLLVGACPSRLVGNIIPIAASVQQIDKS